MPHLQQSFQYRICSALLALQCLAAAAVSPANSPLPLALGNYTFPISSNNPNAANSPLPLALGNYTFPISSNNPNASIFFNLGIFHEFGFNQHEARIAMAQAVSADPSCAMCQWGLAFSWGPFLNHPMMDMEQQTNAYNAIQQAASLTATTTTFEKQLIAASLLRYPSPANATINQTIGFVAYAKALGEMYHSLANPNLSAFYAQALMNLESNNYFCTETMGPDTAAKIPSDLRPYSSIAYTVLSTMLVSTDPVFYLHPLGLHLYIHLTEAGIPNSPVGAAMGEVAADRLKVLNYRGSGHLEHMPGHLYLRVGRYYDAVQANVYARVADVSYTNNHMEPYGPCHNQYFGVYAANVAGMSKEAINGSLYMRKVYAVNVTRGDGPGLEQGWNALLTTYVRFGRWQEILLDTGVVPSNAPGTLYAVLLRHYARGFAFLNGGSGGSGVGAALNELKQLQQYQHQIVARAALDDSGFNGMAVHLAVVANATLSAGVVLASDGGVQRAIELLAMAALNQDKWHYDEPPDWHTGMHACLGRVLLGNQQSTLAEESYQKDLEAYPENGWGLVGLEQVYVLQNRSSVEINQVHARLVTSWKHADVGLPNSSCVAFDFFVAR